MRKIILINWISNINDFNYIKELDSVYINSYLSLFNNNLTEFNYNKPINWFLDLSNNNLTEFNYNKYINWFLDLENNNLNITKKDLKCKVKYNIFL